MVHCRIEDFDGHTREIFFMDMVNFPLTMHNKNINQEPKKMRTLSFQMQVSTDSLKQAQQVVEP